MIAMLRTLGFMVGLALAASMGNPVDPAGTRDVPPGSFSTTGDGDSIVTKMHEAPEPEGSTRKPVSTDDPAPPVMYERMPPALCRDTAEIGTGMANACPQLRDDVINAECPDDAVHLYPLFKRTGEIGPDGEPGNWGPWTYVPSDTCVEPGDLADAVRTAFRQVTVDPSPVHVQPEGGEVLINVPTIVYTEPRTQTFDVTLLGFPVEIEASPSSFAWDFGDGTAPLVTSDPGRAFPDETVTHTFSAPADVSVALTTSWQGRFRIVGVAADPADPDSWSPVDGAVTTTTPAVPLAAVAREAHLVAG